MRTLIVYGSKYGGTGECARRMAARLHGEVTLHNLDESPTVDLTPYGRVAIGTSVYMSKPRKSVVRFCRRNEQALAQKELGLFLCCIQDVEKPLKEQFTLAFPKALRERAKVEGQLGFVIDYPRLSRLDRFIMGLVIGDKSKKQPDTLLSRLDDARIERFCKLLEEERAD